MSPENKKRKVLIIKTGYSEVLHNEYDSRKVSKGDVLRATAILHLYKQHELKENIEAVLTREVDLLKRTLDRVFPGWRKLNWR